MAPKGASDRGVSGAFQGRFGAFQPLFAPLLPLFCPSFAPLLPLFPEMLLFRELAESGSFLQATLLPGHRQTRIKKQAPSTKRHTMQQQQMNKRKFVMMTAEDCNDKKRKIVQLQAEVADYEKRMSEPFPTLIKVSNDAGDYKTRSLMKAGETLARIEYKESIEWCGYGDDRRERWEVYILVPKGSPDNVKILLENLKESWKTTPVLIQIDLLGPDDEEDDNLLIEKYGGMLEYGLDFERYDEEFKCYLNNVYVPPY